MSLLSSEYFHHRKKKLSHRLRLRRRTLEVAKVLKSCRINSGTLLDIGTADGLMLRALSRKFPAITYVGLEKNKHLLSASLSRYWIPICADACVLPVDSQSCDAVVITAVVEHVDNPEELIQEIFRVLKPGGIVIVSCPHPFWDKIAEAVGHLPAGEHEQSFSLEELAGMFYNFRVVLLKPFMLSPVGYPQMKLAEKLLGRAGLCVNQLAVFQKECV